MPNHHNPGKNLNSSLSLERLSKKWMIGLLPGLALQYPVPGNSSHSVFVLAVRLQRLVRAESLAARVTLEFSSHSSTRCLHQYAACRNYRAQHGEPSSSRLAKRMTWVEECYDYTDDQEYNA